MGVDSCQMPAFLLHPHVFVGACSRTYKPRSKPKGRQQSWNLTSKRSHSASLRCSALEKRHLDLVR